MASELPESTIDKPKARQETSCPPNASSAAYLTLANLQNRRLETEINPGNNSLGRKPSLQTLSSTASMNVETGSDISDQTIEEPPPSTYIPRRLSVPVSTNAVPQVRRSSLALPLKLPPLPIIQAKDDSPKSYSEWRTARSYSIQFVTPEDETKHDYTSNPLVIRSAIRPPPSTQYVSEEDRSAA
jgi:hypothetical protein